MTIKTMALFGILALLFSCGKAGDALQFKDLTFGDDAPSSKCGKSHLTVIWSSVTTNTDKSEITDLYGYRIHYGTVPYAVANTYSTVLVANKDDTSIKIEGLAENTTYYVGVKAVDENGNESAFSQERSAVTEEPCSKELSPDIQKLLDDNRRKPRPIKPIWCTDFAPVEVSWKENSEAHSYRLEIAYRKGYTSELFEIDASITSKLLNIRRGQQAYFKVTAFNKDGTVSQNITQEVIYKNPSCTDLIKRNQTDLSNEKYELKLLWN